MDIILWERIKKGDQDAFHDMYCEYSPRLFGYGMKIAKNPQVVQECIQSLFIYIYEKRNTISNPANMSAYLASSLKRMIFHTLNKQTEYVSIDAVDINKEMRFDLAIDMQATLALTDIKEEKLKALQGALDALTPQQREVVYLRFYQQLSITEVAETLGITTQTVKNVTCNAISRLKKDKALLMKFSMLSAYIYYIYQNVIDF